MNYYKYIIVVLVYKNTEVLTDFFHSLERNMSEYRVILVNSFYDNESEKKCQYYAENNDCDFISIENKGYGAGNNDGIEYVLKHYIFDYLIISNSDIIIEDLSTLNILNYDKAIIAPDIRMLSGKKQNPNMWRFSSLYYKLMKLGSKYDCYYVMWSAFVISRLYKILFQLYKAIAKKSQYQIFSPHGSFFIATKNAVKQLHPIFNNDMFLYNEEMHLGLNCRVHDIPVFYIPELSVLHLEGASSGREMKKVCKECAKSFLIMDQAWFGKNK